jgi:two-component system, sporulation sensor kinase E
MSLPKKYGAVVAICILTMIVAGLAMIGWLFNFQDLQTIFPGATAMRFNAALCFFLSGLAVLIAQKGLPRGKLAVFLLFSAIVLVIGGLTLAQDIFNFNSGIDQLFVVDSTPASYSFPHPGRMAFNASVNFFLFGLALIAFASRRKLIQAISQYLFHTVTILSAVALVGYLYGVSFFRVLFYETSMATSTAIAFFLLSIAASLLNTTVGITKLLTERGIGNSMAKRLYLIIVGMIIVFGVLSGQIRSLRIFSSLDIGVAILAVCFMAVSLLLIWNTANWLNRIDGQRSHAEAELMQLNTELEKRVQRRSEAFRQSEEKYRSLIEQASDAIYLLDLEGKFLDVNASMSILVGYSAAELLGMNIRDIVDPESLKTDPLMRNLNHTARSIIRERIFVRRDGTLFPVEVNVKRFGNDKVLAIARDITDRKRMEKEIREAELKFRTIAERSMVGVYIVQNDKFVYVNPRFGGVFGYEAAELMNTVKVDAIIDDNYKHISLGHLQRRMEGAVDSVHYEVKGKRKNGSANWVEFYGSRADIGGIPTVIGSMIDITERKRAEEELKSSEQKYKLLFESNPMPMWMITKDTQVIIAANKAAAKHYGYTQKELMGMGVVALRLPEDREIQNDGYKIDKDYSSKRDIVRHLKKDGTQMYVQLIVNDIVFEGRPVRLSLTLDITEKLKAEESLKKSEANLQTILKTTDAAYALFDLQLKVISFNQKATQFVETHYGRAPQVDDSLADYFPKERFPQFERYTSEVLNGKSINYEVDYRRDDGSICWYDVKLFPIINSNKEILGLMMALHDITEQKKARESLTDAYMRIQNHIGRIKNMAWKQSHLMRSPLANLKGLTEMLKDNPTEGIVFKHMETELNRMDAIIIEMAHEASAHEEA